MNTYAVTQITIPLQMLFGWGWCTVYNKVNVWHLPCEINIKARIKECDRPD